MGLDMYLYRKSYVKNWDHTAPQLRHEISVSRGGVARDDIKPERICYIVEEVAYWRKANAIHKWFVDNCQNGEDDCRNSPVETEQLAELVRLCKEVLGAVETVDGEIHTGTTHYPDGRAVRHTEPGQVVAQAGIARAKLPTQSGFFFGGTAYDQYYLEDLKKTVEMLEPFLNDREGEFYYSSSW